MKAVHLRHALFLATLLAATVVTGCADVHQDPAASRVVSSASASPAGNAASPTSVPF